MQKVHAPQSADTILNAFLLLFTSVLTMRLQWMEKWEKKEGKDILVSYQSHRVSFFYIRCDWSTTHCFSRWIYSSESLFFLSVASSYFFSFLHWPHTYRILHIKQNGRNRFTGEHEETSVSQCAKIYLWAYMRAGIWHNFLDLIAAKKILDDYGSYLHSYHPLSIIFAFEILLHIRYKL